MKIGVVSYWFNRGQATVGRYLRSIFDGLGHETHVLARPTQDHFDLSRFIDMSDVWDQPDVTKASHFEIPKQEYLDWASHNSLEMVFFDQNYQFAEISALRKTGVKTIGRFVWESFKASHASEAKKAFDTIYSLTRCEQSRYEDFGIESPFVPWGCHPELLQVKPQKKDDAIYFFYPGGYLSKRKPTKAVIEAFCKVTSPDIRLIVKTQTESRLSCHIGERDNIDPRIILVTDDLDSQGYYQLFSSSHVCMAPSRWEGLGLHLYESIAFGLPIITNDEPPMNEVVVDGFNGLNVFSYPCGRTESGVRAIEPSIKHLVTAIEALSDKNNLRSYEINTENMRDRLNWKYTVEGFDDLLKGRNYPKDGMH